MMTSCDGTVGGARDGQRTLRERCLSGTMGELSSSVGTVGSMTSPRVTDRDGRRSVQCAVRDKNAGEDDVTVIVVGVKR